MQQQHPSDFHPQPAMQFSNQQQMQPPMMMCPVQYVYDPQILMPSSNPEEQVQSNQTFPNQTYIINVQNPPPWIQNRSNMVYMPPMQMNNLQPYIPQNMVQSPIFNYQYQPMIMQQDIRHMMPNLISQNLVQNPQRIIQNPQNFVQNTQNIIQNPVRYQLEQKQELPILTQMLQSQPKAAPSQQSGLVASMHTIRPQTPNGVRSVITVNPMTRKHTCHLHHTHIRKDQIPSETPKKIEVQQKNEVPREPEIPQHIRNQIPVGLSVKTVFKVPKTATVKPNEFENIALAKDIPKLYPKPLMKNNMTNTEPKINCKRKIRDILEQNAKESDVKTAKKNREVKQEDKVRSRVENNIKQINSFMVKHNLLRNVAPAREGPQIEQNDLVNDMPQREEKLLRNTVYVQARGRINETLQNEMNIANDTTNHSLGGDESLINETNNDNITSNPNVGANELLLNENNNANNTNTESIGANESFLNDIKNSIKICLQKIQVFEKLPIKTNLLNNTCNDSEGANESIQNKTNNAQNASNQNNVVNNVDTPINDEIETEIILPAHVIGVQEKEEASIAENISTDENMITHANKDCGIMTRNKLKKTENTKNLQKAESKDMVSEDIDMTEPLKKYVLTHVLDGHIIQESNVPFVVQRPSISPIKNTLNDMLEVTESPSNINNEDTEKSLVSKINDTGLINKTGEIDTISNNNIGEMAENERDTETNKEENLATNTVPNSAELDNVIENEEKPFQHIKKSTVKSWTVSDLFTHLNNPSWIESALKLREEEIDGESLLLVNKDQLIQIGIDEHQAQILGEYLEKVDEQ